MSSIRVTRFQDQVQNHVTALMRSTARWWRSIDRVLFIATGALMLVGITLCYAASPVTATRLGIDDPLYFVERQMIFFIPSIAILLGMTFLRPLQAKRLGVLIFIGAGLLMIAGLIIGPEVNGAKRWLLLGGFSLQPSELMKPGFVMTAAWLLAEGARDKSFPGGLIALLLYGVMSVLLLMQPDYGQWVLLTAIWGVMFFIAGWSWLWIGGLGAAAGVALLAGYNYAPHVASRIDRFLNPGTGDNYQVDKALETLANGGLFGKDFSGATQSFKYSLPDAHTDYIFAVAGEEAGFMLGALIVILFATLVVRSFMRASGQSSIFMQTAICGLGALIGFQAIINMGVSLNLLPSKGMTLPFISYGGSSLIASGLTIGLLLSLTRKRRQHWTGRDQLP